LTKIGPRHDPPLESIAQEAHSISPESCDSIACSTQILRWQFVQCIAAGRAQKENSHAIANLRKSQESDADRGKDLCSKNDFVHSCPFIRFKLPLTSNPCR